MKILECLALILWPLVSLVLGFVGGVIIGVFTTLLVFAITLFRTPMHMAKMMYVTATTEVCFKPYRYFDPALRIAVLFLVPIPHLLWLVGVTLFCLFCGTVYYINKATKTVFKRAYLDAYKKASSNIQLEKESHLGKYIQSCQKFMEKDEKSYSTIYCLKGMCAVLPGVPLGALPFVPFSIAVLAITLYRLPVNVFRTMKVAYMTVTLKLDLKICALLTLPLVHTLFPLAVFVSALVGSLCFFVYSTSRSIFKGNSPFDKWGEFHTGLQKYYQAHQQFVGEGYLGRYDHPTGIPNGWRGESYGLPLRQILRWQWDFLVCCALLAVGFPICLVGSSLIFGVKVIPGIFSWWRQLCKWIGDKSQAEILGLWAVYLIGFALIPAGAVLAAVIAVVAGTLKCFKIPYKYIARGSFLAGLNAIGEALYKVDGWDIFALDEFRLFGCLPDPEEPYWVTTAHQSALPGAGPGFRASYWNLFAKQCIRTADSLLEKNWMSMDSVRGMDPSAIQAIPAVAVLTILVDSIRNNNAKHAEDISWEVNGTLCLLADRPPLGNVASLLWQKVMQVKYLLLSNRSLTEEASVKAITGMLCSNTNEITAELKGFVASQKRDENSPQARAIKKVRSILIDLSLMLLRVKPFQDRMEGIFVERVVVCGDHADVERGVKVDEVVCGDDVKSGVVVCGDNADVERGVEVDEVVCGDDVKSGVGSDDSDGCMRPNVQDGVVEQLAVASPSTTPTEFSFQADFSQLDNASSNNDTETHSHDIHDQPQEAKRSTYRAAKAADGTLIYEC